MLSWRCTHVLMYLHFAYVTRAVRQRRTRARVSRENQPAIISPRTVAFQTFLHTLIDVFVYVSRFYSRPFFHEMSVLSAAVRGGYLGSLGTFFSYWVEIRGIRMQKGEGCGTSGLCLLFR